MQSSFNVRSIDCVPAWINNIMYIKFLCIMMVLKKTYKVVVCFHVNIYNAAINQPKEEIANLFVLYKAVIM